jgi:hypothetical protein
VLQHHPDGARETEAVGGGRLRRGDSGGAGDQAERQQKRGAAAPAIAFRRTRLS